MVKEGTKEGRNRRKLSPHLAVVIMIFIYRGIWETRGNLQGYQFNAVIGHWKPFTYNLINDTNRKIIQAEGFVIDVMNYLKKHLNFTLNLTFKERWTDIVEMVHKQQVDLAATGFSQTLKRSTLVDFSFPLTSISLRLVHVLWARKFKKVQAKKTRELK